MPAFRAAAAAAPPAFKASRLAALSAALCGTPRSLVDLPTLFRLLLLLLLVLASALAPSAAVARVLDPALVSAEFALSPSAITRSAKTFPLGLAVGVLFDGVLGVGELLPLFRLLPPVANPPLIHPRSRLNESLTWYLPLRGVSAPRRSGDFAEVPVLLPLPPPKKVRGDVGLATVGVEELGL